MKCVECKCYCSEEDECINGGDTTNPTEDIFCGEAGDTEKKFVVKHNLHGVIGEVRT